MNLFVSRLTNKIAFLLAIFILVVFIFFIEYQVLEYTNGVVSYPYDSIFLTMAIAKNLALQQVWGISAYEFTPASSSIFYPLLLSFCFKIFGMRLVIPLIINIIAAISLLSVIQRWLIDEMINPFAQLLILVSAIVFIPLPILIVTGMEHTLESLFCFLFIYEFARFFNSASIPERKNKSRVSCICIYALLAVATRYEALFPVLSACILLLLWRKKLVALKLLACAVSPILLFGLYSLHNGGYFIPNSILLKSGNFPMSGESIYQLLSGGIFDRLYYAYPSRGNIVVNYLIIGLLLLYFAYRRRIQQERALHIAFVLIVTTILLHIFFVNSIWYYRYEAYLVAICIPFTGAIMAKCYSITSIKITRLHLVGMLSIVIVLIPFCLRSKQAFKDIVGTCINNYQQHYQLGIFLHTYYDMSKVALSDVGTVSFLTEGKNLDLSGIANTEILKSKMDGYYTDLFLEWQVKKENIKVITIFDRLYKGEFLKQYEKIAVWHINDLILPGIADICFYATDKESGLKLKESLIEFQPLLPKGISVVY